MTPAEIRKIRLSMGLTQQAFAASLNVSFVTLNRWENGKSRPSSLARSQLDALAEKNSERSAPGLDGASGVNAGTLPVPLSFLGDANKLRILVEGERLSYGHQFNPAFATETSRIDPLPHQRLAVYERMLPQRRRLRFLLADDAGAGKTIMTGLYVRECLTRRHLRRVLIVVPAGLVGNWQRELRDLFGLHFRVVTSQGAKNGNPFDGQHSDLSIVSVDSLRGDILFGCLGDPRVAPYDLAVFDEAHKLAAYREANGRIRATDRYRLAEAIAGVPNMSSKWRLHWAAQHLLLLTATPHMGKSFPYYCLWRLLEPELLSTELAFSRLPPEFHSSHFIRRTKEEMLDLRGRPLFPRRLCDTVKFRLNQGPVSEQALYDNTTIYIREHYNQARILNQEAARFVMTIFQRRLASSTWALLCSLRNRLQKLDQLIDEVRSGALAEQELILRRQQYTQEKQGDKLVDMLATRTAEEESVINGREEHEDMEIQALGVFMGSSLEELELERKQVSRLVSLADAVHADGKESKFARMIALLQDPDYREQKVIIYTEHKDTLDFLIRRLEGMGYADQVAHVHGGLNFQQRDEEVERFRKPHDAGSGGAQLFAATDAAAEGINLQFCGILINYDIPWNPARLEQRMGRIHRYGQKRERVTIINLVADETREGRVVATLLDKLEEIRTELGSDKVFDVIGRIFEGGDLSEYVRRANTSDEDAHEQASRLSNELTAGRVSKSVANEEPVYPVHGEGDNIRASLPRLQETLAVEEMRHLLPGYVWRYLKCAAPLIGLDLVGDPEGVFSFRPRRPGALDALASVLEQHPRSVRTRFTVRQPSEHEAAIFLHPGEPAFAALSGLAAKVCEPAGQQGAIYTDASASEPYLLHIARVSVIRATDPMFPEFRPEQTIEQRLVGIKQQLNGHFQEAPVEQLMLLEPGSRAVPASHGFLSNSERWRQGAHDYIVNELLERLCELHRAEEQSQSSESERELQRAFDYKEAELAANRKQFSKKARDGNAEAAAELEQVKGRQRSLCEHRSVAIRRNRRAVELIARGETEIIATALVQPSHNAEDARKLDTEIELIAMRLACAHESIHGAEVRDVSTPAKARGAGLSDHPGFDILSKRPDGVRKIEVKGRASRGGVELTENEWAQACNLGNDYWLYAAFDCGTAQPRLYRVQNPFRRLISRSAERATVGYGDIARSAEAA